MEKKMYEPVEIEIQGVAPLLMHNGQLADPLNKWTVELKKFTGKRKKTDADYREMARIEWYGGIYVHEGKVCIPGELIESTLVAAAKKNKKGKLFTAGVLCDGHWPLIYEGPKDIDKLWKDEKFRDARLVKVQMARIVRTRPRFDQWSLKFIVHFLPSVLNKSDIEEAIVIAGQIIGLADHRPKFGRFEVVSIK